MKGNIFILIGSLGLCWDLSFGHDIPVHRQITEHAAESARDDSSACADFFDVISSDYAYQTATHSMIDGSGWEDNRDVDADGKADVGGKRSLNHFYDPINKIGLTVGTGTVGRDSFYWSSVTNSPGVDVKFIGFSVNTGTSNIWSWSNARGYEWLGLTATNQSGRQIALTNMFRAVGQVMHLLEDASQPQHVRNEQHLDRFWKMDLRSRTRLYLSKNPGAGVPVTYHSALS